MTESWGRAAWAGTWPRPKAASTLAAVLISAVVTIATGAVQYSQKWTPLQRWYFPTWLRCTLRIAVELDTRNHDRTWFVDDRNGLRLALNEDVGSVGHGPFGDIATLTDVAVQAGARRVFLRTWTGSQRLLRTFLVSVIYRDQMPVSLFAPAPQVGVATLLITLAFAIPADLARARARRHGRRVKGPQLVTCGEFNRWYHARGVGFRQVSHPFTSESYVRIPRAMEASHFLVMGDSGTGKSALIRQVLQQLETRQETAIVYDPALEYIEQFYTPERGDIILNPLDSRMPYWTPGDEWRHEAETLTLATSLFPDRHQENAFFTEAPRRIFAHLLTCEPSPAELAEWLASDTEIDRKVKDTAYAPMVDRHAPAQRAGVLASLNMVADTLKLLPEPAIGRQSWSATKWSVERRGWIFLTSTPETRARLVPLTSLWLDTLVLRLMNQGRPHRQRTWFVLDELASLQRLPQLHTAITENRKSGNPVILGFQGRSQIEARYGRDAEAILSQPATKIFLRTSEPSAAKWISDAIGEIETERLRESRASSGRGHTYGLERHVEPLVMASEIAGLKSLRGFLKLGNLVVRLSTPFLDVPKKAAAFVERPMKVRPRQAATGESSSCEAAPEQEEQLKLGGNAFGPSIG